MILHLMGFRCDFPVLHQYLSILFLKNRYSLVKNETFFCLLKKCLPLQVHD